MVYLLQVRFFRDGPSRKFSPRKKFGMQPVIHEVTTFLEMSRIFIKNFQAEPHEMIMGRASEPPKTIGPDRSILNRPKVYCCLPYDSFLINVMLQGKITIY